MVARFPQQQNQKQGLTYLVAAPEGGQHGGQRPGVAGEHPCAEAAWRSAGPGHLALDWGAVGAPVGGGLWGDWGVAGGCGGGSDEGAPADAEGGLGHPPAAAAAAVAAAVAATAVVGVAVVAAAAAGPAGQKGSVVVQTVKDCA